MRLFKRLSTTFLARLDQAVGEIENHDAVVQATFNDMRRKVAEAKVRLTQVQREAQRLQAHIIDQQEHAQRWRQRAVACASSDDAKAMSCVSRYRQCEANAERLTHALTQYQQTADKLAHDIHYMEQRLSEVKQKLTLMRARESTSAALQATGASNTDITALLADTFDRWETNISQAEFAADESHPMDLIEQEFIQSEHEEELRQVLDALLAEEDQS